MGTERAFRQSVGDITHQNIDGEVIAINIVTGKYFSLRGGAAAIWEALATPATASQLGRLFSGAPATAPKEIEALLDQLLAEKLVQEASGAQAPASAIAPPVAWSTLQFEIYSDMNELLLADPIHDVGVMGWPNPPEQQS